MEQEFTQFSGLRGETIQLLIAYFSNHNLLGPVYLDLSAFCPCIGFLSYCLIWLHSIILLNQMLEEAVEIIGCEICSFKSCQFRFNVEDFLLMETQHTGFLNDELFLRFWAQIYFHSKIQHEVMNVMLGKSEVVEINSVEEGTSMRCFRLKNLTVDNIEDIMQGGK